MAETEKVCPPHHWEVSMVHIEGNRYDHYYCLRCGAQKDVPFAGFQAPNKWRSNASKKKLANG